MIILSIAFYYVFLSGTYCMRTVEPLPYKKRQFLPVLYRSGTVKSSVDLISVLEIIESLSPLQTKWALCNSTGSLLAKYRKYRQLPYRFSPGRITTLFALSVCLHHLNWLSVDDFLLVFKLSKVPSL